MKLTEQLASLDELELGPQLHKSLENICFHAKFRGERVVVKKVIVKRSESITKFEDEVKILCRPELNKSVVVPRAVIRVPPHYSIVLPYMENGSISTILSRCVLPVELIVCFAIDAARSLEAIHGSGYVHRDIKSANLLVSSDWRAWITDLGSAELVFDENGNPVKKEDAPLIQPSGGFHKRNIDGTTLGYTAPEIFRNTPAVQASDIYALGITIAEMLTGVPPFTGMEKEDADMHTVMDASYSEHALMVAITNDHLRPGLVSVSERPGMPMELIDLIRAMWHPEVSMRPTASQCSATLIEIASKIGVDCSFGPARTEFAKGIHPIGGSDGNISVDQDDIMVEEQPRQINQEGYQAHDVPNIPIEMEVDRDSDTTFGSRAKFNESIPVGAFATSGRRGADKMEDRHSVFHFSLGGSNGELTVCTIFDGHGGAACANFANQNLGLRIGKGLTQTGSVPPQEERGSLVSRSFLEIDQAFRNGPCADKSGCTAMAAMMWHPNKAACSDQIRIMIANAGDCRAVLCRNVNGIDKAFRLSRDHHASDQEEQERIRSVGGSITMTRDGKHRVQGHIQVTRALGDAAMKPYGVTAEPEIKEYDLDVSKGDDFIIFATDGVWDTLTDQDAVNMVRSTAKECGLAAKRVGGEALARGSHDNISVIVCFLKHYDQTKDVAFV